MASKVTVKEADFLFLTFCTYARGVPPKCFALTDTIARPKHFFPTIRLL